ECPTGTDMSTYKAEVLYQSYRGKLRPMAHYVLGFLPQLARLSTPMAPVVNRISRLPGFGQLAKQIGGIDARRSIPQFAATTFRKWWTTTAEAGPRSNRSQTPPPAEAGEPSAGTLTGGSRKTDEVVLLPIPGRTTSPRASSPRPWPCSNTPG